MRELHDDMRLRRRRIVMITAMIGSAIVGELTRTAATSTTKTAADTTHYNRQGRHSVVYIDATGTITAATNPGAVATSVPIKYSTTNGGCYMSVYSPKGAHAVARINDHAYLIGVMFVYGGSHTQTGPCEPNLPIENLKHIAQTLFHAEGQPITFDGAPDQWLESGIQN